MLKLLSMTPDGLTSGVFFMLPEKYNLDAVDENVDACYAAIRPLYELYSAHDIAEAHYRIRKELDMIVEREEKKKRIKKLKDELENENNSV